MAWSIDDRWLWLGFGAVFFVAAKGIAYGLQDTLRLIEYDEPSQSVKTNNENHAEDSISLESLQTLVASPNADISNAAISLLVSRFASSDTACNELTLDLFSHSASVRERARLTLALFDSHPLPTDFPKPDILRVDAVRDLQTHARESDQRLSVACMRFFQAMGRRTHGHPAYIRVAAAVDMAMTMPMHQISSFSNNYIPGIRDGGGGGGGGGGDSNGDDPFRDVDFSVESLDELLSRTASDSRPVRVPTAALSALLHAQAETRALIHGGNGGPRFPEESPEEAEVRRRRNRSARVMEVDNDYLVV